MRVIEKRPGYGQWLRGQLESRQISQIELANAAGVSRQTIHRALAADEVSTKTAERIAAVLNRPLSEASSGAGGHSIAPPPRAWVDATDLVLWSDRRDAQGDLPALIRRLALATTDMQSVSFRSAEGIQLGGWDGRISAINGTAFVPSGSSMWELGTTSRPAEKASADYNKRVAELSDAERQELMLVAVTTRRWTGKDAWVRERQAERAWRDVRVLDADDL